MKTIKLLSILFSAALIVASCSEKTKTDQNNNLVSTNESDENIPLDEAQAKENELIDRMPTARATTESLTSCTLNAEYELKSDKWHVEMTTIDDIAVIRLVNYGTNPKDTCIVKLADNPYLKLKVTTSGLIKKLQLFTFNGSIPSVGHQTDTFQLDNPIFFDIVKNGFHFPSGAKYKIIGTDDDRHYDVKVSTSLYAIGNLENGQFVYLKYLIDSDDYVVGSTSGSLNTKVETSLISKTQITCDLQEVGTCP